MKLKRELIEKLPKTDLHVHLDGSLRLSTIFELAQEQNVQLPAKNEKDLKKIVCCDKECKSLDEYLEAFNITLSVMQVKDALTRIAYELA
ncbi:MAG: adenosine deaminase, partial [Candidatus Cloacimonetes bacterium]|nr:adenosine deaminase [Candidatus Cloacimonadota bacterium]